MNLQFRFIPPWTIGIPVAGFTTLAVSGLIDGAWIVPLLLLALLACVVASVHHAEVIAARVGEPFGTLVLAIAVTVIEVGLIISIISSGNEASSTLPRDTIFATIMIIMNGLVGLCLLFGAARHHEQKFRLHGVNAGIATLSVLSAVTLILPNYTTTLSGPVYSPVQLGFIASVSLVLYGTFVVFQTVRHRDYFIADKLHAGEARGVRPSNQATVIALVFLLASLSVVILLAKRLSPSITWAVRQVGAPEAVVGIFIAIIVLLPESVAAVKAARANMLQTSLNLAIGSALATIGLTIPVIALASLLTGWILPLGVGQKEMVLLAVTLLVSTLSLGTGRTTVMQGAIHLVLFFVYLFISMVP